MSQTNHLVRVWWPGVQGTDTVVSIGSGGYPAFTLVSALPALNPQFYFEKDVNGNDVLSAIKTTTSSLVGVFTNAGTLAAIPMPHYDLVGGHPPYRPPHGID
jgi:hypothetical protein